jgi:hypothetical protein
VTCTGHARLAGYNVPWSGMRLRHLIEHVRAQNWTAVVLDFLIVVAGIVVGVQVNDWWASRVDARRETAYLVELQEDLRQSIDEIESDSAAYRTIAQSMIALLEASRRHDESLTVEQLNRHCSRLLYMIGTPIVADTYSNLTGSGDLSLIRSQELRNALAAFYARTEIIRLVSQTHELQLVNTFQPYIVNELDYLAIYEQDRKRSLPAEIKAALPRPFDERRIREVLATPRFRNVVAIKYDIATDMLDVLATTLERARDLERLLARELSAQEAGKS